MTGATAPLGELPKITLSAPASTRNTITTTSMRITAPNRWLVLRRSDALGQPAMNRALGRGEVLISADADLEIDDREGLW